MNETAYVCQYDWDDIEIPGWANYIATDEDGSIYCYANEPYTDARVPGIWISENNKGYYYLRNIGHNPQWIFSLEGRTNNSNNDNLSGNK